jgi:vitamin B12 transporter
MLFAQNSRHAWAWRFCLCSPVIQGATFFGLFLAALSPVIAETAIETQVKAEANDDTGVVHRAEIAELDTIQDSDESAGETFAEGGDQEESETISEDAEDSGERNSEQNSEPEPNPVIEDDAEDADVEILIDRILDQPVFAPFRQDRPLRDSSRPIYVVPREQLDVQGTTTVQDALRYLPGVLSEGTTGGQLGAQSAQFIRGGDSTQTLILLDGRPINDLGFVGGFDLAEFTTDFVERVEVFPGGSSALYGSSGVGGTINIVTQEPTDEPEFSIRAGLGSFGYNQQVIRARGSAGDIGWVVGYNRTYATNDFPFELETIDDDGTRDNADANYNNLNLKLVADINDRNRLTFSGLYLSRDIGVPGGVPTGEGSLGQFNSLSDEARQYSEDFLFDLRWDSQLSEDDRSRLTARVFTDFLSYTYRDPSFSRDEVDRNSLGFQVQHSLKLAETQNLTYGLDFRTISSENNTYSFFDGSTAENYDNNIDQGALFALYNLDITEDLSVNLGLRQEFNSLENGSFTSPSAGILWNVSESTTLRANYARSFNAPLISALEGFAAFDVAGNPDLNPERGNSFDLGIDQKIGDFGLFRLTLFLNHISEAIAFEFGSPSTFVNIGETETIGLEAGLDVELAKHLFAFTNVTLNNTEILRDSNAENEGNDLSFRDANSVNLGLAYARPDGLYAGILLRYIGEFFVDSANTETLGDYVTVDLKTQIPIGEHLVLNASLNNLFDENFELYPGYPGLSRNARASLRWTF